MQTSKLIANINKTETHFKFNIEKLIYVIVTKGIITQHCILVNDIILYYFKINIADILSISYFIEHHQT